MSQSRTWCFTLNNPNLDHDANGKDEFQALCERLATVSRYAVIGKEIGDSGTPHLQGYVSFRTSWRFNRVKKLVGDRAHIECAKGNAKQNREYCIKDGDYWEHGTPPSQSQGKRTDLDDIATLVDNGVSIRDIATAHPATYIRNYRGIQHYASLQVEDYTHDTVRGIWIYGAPGTGKSHHARLFANGRCEGSLYIKAQNKWFDGYNGEECILLDDLDTNALGHYLKIWCDKYACSGEIKGGTTKLRHKYFIITSNYTPESLWPDDEVMAAAVRRRCKMIHMTGLVEHLNELSNL